ncbi:folate-binding protein 1 [Cornus florida]|uniref:folate-binding protein 1 n=1 Tax=Cornus florida TaxID=4283 RepID=UPI00289B2BCE|nr:folate-binding protein 1 [Cornus florida]
MRLVNHALILLLLFTSFILLVPYASGKSSGVCISQGGRFPPFPDEGKPPRKVRKGPRDLTLCRVFRRKTCCDVTQTHPAFVSIRKLALTGEASQECLQLWELLECSICDPHVGVQPGPPVICASFCDRIYQACSSAYFAMDAMTQEKNDVSGVAIDVLLTILQVLAPCGVGDFVCGRASEWISNGTELCRVAGFSVTPPNEIEETSCYGGKTSLDSIADSWSASQSGMQQKADNSGVLEDFQQWLREMPFNERVSWAVGGMVLTAGLLFASKRKSHNQRQKIAAIQRTARNMEAKMNQKFQVNQGPRKVGRR